MYPGFTNPMVSNSASHLHEAFSVEKAVEVKASTPVRCGGMLRNPEVTRASTSTILAAHQKTWQCSFRKCRKCTYFM